MKSLIVANWKCNPTTLREAKRLFNSVTKGLKNVRNAEVVICPPFVYLHDLGASAYAKGFDGLRLGSQDCFWGEKGACTGEVSPVMLKDLGVKYVIIGHSERRKHQKETDGMINKKLKAAMAAGLKSILCIDNLSQLKKDLKGISGKVIIAYEPLFAIGTGRPCSPEKAEKMRILIKGKTDKNTPILYGGSVNSQNVQDYIKKSGFQGLLVGGASLNPKEFIKMVKSLS